MPTFTRNPGSAKSRSLKPLQRSYFALFYAVGLSLLCSCNYYNMCCSSRNYT